MKIIKYFYALILGLTISFVGLVAGYYMYKPQPLEPKKSIEIPKQQPTVTKNTIIRYKHSFTRDNIIQEKEALAPYYMIGKTKQELKEAMADWNIESFSPAMVVVSKSVMGESPQHYVLKVKNGYVAVYYKNGTLKEITNTPVTGLTLNEQLSLENGMEIQGDLELTRMLENLES